MDPGGMFFQTQQDRREHYRLEARHGGCEKTFNCNRSRPCALYTAGRLLLVWACDAWGGGGGAPTPSPAPPAPAPPAPPPPAPPPPPPPPSFSLRGCPPPRNQYRCVNAAYLGELLSAKETRNGILPSVQRLMVGLLSRSVHQRLHVMLRTSDTFRVFCVPRRIGTTRAAPWIPWA